MSNKSAMTKTVAILHSPLLHFSHTYIIIVTLSHTAVNITSQCKILCKCCYEAMKCCTVPFTAHNVPLPPPEKLKKLGSTHNMLNYITNMLTGDYVSNMVAISLCLQREEFSI
jgi:hypothetical protein